MGYYVETIACDCSIHKDNCAKAADALMNYANDEKCVDVWFMHKWGDFLSCVKRLLPDDGVERLQALLDSLCIETYKPKNSDYLEVVGYEGKTWLEQEAFRAIAPYVEPDSYIEWRGEESAFWRFDFDGEKLTERHGEIIWR